MTTGIRLDPITAFRFIVLLDALPVAGFSECSGLQVQLDVHEYLEGGLNTHAHKLPTRAKLNNITLKRGIVDRFMYNWFADVVQGRLRYRSGSIIVQDESGLVPRVVWEFQRAFPIRWVGPDLNAQQSSVAVETVEMAHHGLVRRV